MSRWRHDAVDDLIALESSDPYTRHSEPTHVGHAVIDRSRAFVYRFWIARKEPR